MVQATGVGCRGRRLHSCTGTWLSVSQRCKQLKQQRTLRGRRGGGVWSWEAVVWPLPLPRQWPRYGCRLRVTRKHYRPTSQRTASLLLHSARLLIHGIYSRLKHKNEQLQSQKVKIIRRPCLTAPEQVNLTSGLESKVQKHTHKKGKTCRHSNGVGGFMDRLTVEVGTSKLALQCVCVFLGLTLLRENWSWARQQEAGQHSVRVDEAGPEGTTPKETG